MRHDQPTDTPYLIYHYTSLNNLESILETGIRFYQASKYDDDLRLSLEEYLRLIQVSESQSSKHYADKIEEDKVTTARNNVKAQRDRTFIACFTDSPIDDYMWKNYGDNGNGVCITIQSDEVWRNITHTSDNHGVCSIGSVDYSDDYSVIVDDACDRYYSSGDPLSRELFAPYLLIADYIKALKHSNEREIRIAFYDWYFHRGFMNPEIEERYLQNTGFGDIQKDDYEFVQLELGNLIPTHSNSPFVSIWVRNQETLEKARAIVSRSRFPSTRVLFKDPLSKSYRL